MLTTDQQIFEQIKKAENILITFGSDWSGDAVASSLALFLFLRKLDKKVSIVAQNPGNNHTALQIPTKLFSFLPSFSEIKNELENLRKFIISLDITNAKVSQIKYRVEKNNLNFIIAPKEGFFTHNDISSSSSGFKYDLIITLDSPDLESLGKIYDNDTEFFYKTPIINIDHQSDNEEHGQINFIELTAVSVTEVLFSLFEGYSRDMIDEDIATCLLAGLISKTRNFKTSNITPHTLLITSQLISMGGRREQIVTNLYRSRSLNVLKLWGRVLARLTGALDNKLVWSTISQEDFDKTESSEKDLGDIIDELIVNIPQAKVVALIYEKITKENTAVTNLIVYSTKNINSMDIIKTFNPAGTKRMAQATIDKPLKVAQNEIINTIKERISKLPI